jgi:hypothetical protein
MYLSAGFRYLPARKALRHPNGMTVDYAWLKEHHTQATWLLLRSVSAWRFLVAVGDVLWNEWAEWKRARFERDTYRATRKQAEALAAWLGIPERASRASIRR